MIIIHLNNSKKTHVSEGDTQTLCRTWITHDGRWSVDKRYRDGDEITCEKCKRELNKKLNQIAGDNTRIM